MIKRQKQTQHKPSREERKSQEVQELKSEIKLLRKQVTRLRKEANKPEIVKYEDSPFGQVEINDVPKCPLCGSTNIRSMTMPSGTILTLCKACGKRTNNAKQASEVDEEEL